MPFTLAATREDNFPADIPARTSLTTLPAGCVSILPSGNVICTSAIIYPFLLRKGISALAMMPRNNTLLLLDLYYRFIVSSKQRLPAGRNHYFKW
jgi:hypothetical protein